MISVVKKEGKKPSASASRAKSARSLEEENRSLRRELKDARLSTAALDQEVRTRRTELSQSLAYQLAISDILGVISRSHSDVQPIFETIVEAAQRLCRSEHAFIFRLHGDEYRLAAAKDASSAQIKLLQEHPIVPDRGSVTGRVAIERRAIQVADVLTDAEYTLNVSGVRTTLGVPLLRHGIAVGIIVLTRAVVEPFTQEQIDLVSTFATQALIAIENVRLFDEAQAGALQLSKTVEELRALGDVTRAINSTVDLEIVLNTIVAKATQISGTDAGAIYMFDRSTQEFWLRTTHGVNEEILAAIKDRRVHLKETRMGDALEQRTSIQFPDIRGQTGSPVLDVIIRAGFRALLVVPLLDSDGPVGALVLRRKRPGNFLHHTIEVMQTFAAQSVLAIRNARLFEEIQERTNDLSESLQQQTATADVLKVISRSTFDLQTVFQVLVESAARLCDADWAHIWRPKEETFILAASFGLSGKHSEYIEYLRSLRIEPSRGSIVGRALLERRTVQILDVQADSDYKLSEVIRIGDYRTMLGVPLLREGIPIGAIALTRRTVQAFTEKQIELITTFADQAVIAIENVRLFDEVQARTGELSEALTYQTGSANILSVIASSPTDVGPVLDAIVESASELCEADDAIVFLKDGGDLRSAAHSGPIAEGPASVPITRTLMTGRSFLDRKPVHVRDVLSAEGAEFPETQKIAKSISHRTMLTVPLLREGESIGVILLRRKEVHPFRDKQITLLQTFADQAVIAIGNVRMFEQVQAKTRDLSESLQQQTATADVLKLISRSTFDLPAVLQTLVESAARLCDADQTLITREKDGAFYRAEAYGFSAEFQEYVKDIPIKAERGSASGRALLEGRVVHIPDVKADPEYTWTEAPKLGGFRTVLTIPMLREGVPIGVLGLARSEVRPFTDKQIELATTFADQAVIAIKNVLLFDEVQASTRELSQSVEELRALGEVSRAVNSTVDLETVLNTIVAKATQLSSTEAGAIYVFDDTAQEFHLRATYGMDEAIIAEIKDRHIHIGDTAIGKAAQQRIPIQIADIQDDQNTPVFDVIVRAGFRALLIVPLLSADRTVGALVVRRKQAGEFPKHTVDLLQTFAAQSVLAIQNARLFENVEARTRELAASLEDLRTAQDRLVQTQKLASLGQLTAGIAHEIKNPLNFVNNFSTVSIDLIDEMQETLDGMRLDEDKRTELNQLAETLRGNLDKVVQHGKRADAIVKNMLLHSRQRSGEHRPVDVNALVEESLNLAYHGARAEKPDFNITLKRSFDPNAGEIDVFPQEITRVLLNLISNGFYAATKRKGQADRDSYEPTLAAATKNLGDSVEIRIRDSGTGIPPEVKEQMFNPFFTTKPAGEGTGLGLSLSYDIVVKQHSGSIEVDTRPDEFTEFKVILPRIAATSKAGADK